MTPAVASGPSPRAIGTTGAADVPLSCVGGAIFSAQCSIHNIYFRCIGNSGMGEGRCGYTHVSKRKITFTSHFTMQYLRQSNRHRQPHERWHIMSAIEKVHAREVLDSRGNPTVEAEVTLADGSFGRAMVPSGASTGAFRSCASCATATRVVTWARASSRPSSTSTTSVPTPSWASTPSTNAAVDSAALIAADGTPNKTKLGANAILGVSPGRRPRCGRVGGPVRCTQYLGGVNAHTAAHAHDEHPQRRCACRQ